jgi:serine/threonine-protein kinase
MPDWESLRKSLLSEKTSSVLPPSVQLPILPKALLEFQNKAKDPEVETQELSRIISSDAGLSTELLRNANTCQSESRTRIVSVNQALVRLGIRNTLLHLTISGVRLMMKSSSSKLVNFQNFWNTNLERSLLARELARLMGADQDLAFTAGMLQDFLLPLIGNELIDDYLEFAENRDKYGSIVEFERERLGWDHAVAAAHVMRDWQFPDELVCCVCLHHRGLDIRADRELGSTSVAAAAIASLMPDALRQNANGLELLMSLEGQWDAFNLGEIAEKIGQEFQAMTSTQHHFSLLRFYENAVKRAAASRT